MNKIISVLVFFLSINPAFSQYLLEEVIPEKGYILSVDLDNKKCKNIWNKQINIFKDNNNHIKDPDLILVGQNITVQNCKKQEIKKDPIIKKEKKDDSGLFVGLGLLHQINSKKDEDPSKKGLGLKASFGKYFQLSNAELKTSFSFSYIESKYDLATIGEVKRQNGFLSLATSYLKPLKNNMKIGPALSILYSPTGSEFRHPRSDYSEDKVSLFGGFNFVYDLNSRWAIDSKLINRVESRLNLLTTLSIEYKL